jgi:hypothetical protein
VIVFFFSNTKKTKDQKKKKNKKKKPKERKELTFKLPLYPLTFGYRFHPSVLLSPTIFFFSSRRKKKQRKKTIEKNRNVEKGGRFPSSSYYVLSLLGLAFALPFLPFCFKRFFLAFSSSQA